MELDWSRIQHALTPANLHFESRVEFARLKNVDVLRRFRNLPKYHTPPRELSVVPPPSPSTAASQQPHSVHPQSPAESVYNARRFMPLMSIKPFDSGALGHASYRGRGPRPFSAEQYQERIDRRGMGEKKNMHKMPNLHKDTVGYRPRRGY